MRERIMHVQVRAVTKNLPSSNSVFALWGLIFEDSRIMKMHFEKSQNPLGWKGWTDVTSGQAQDLERRILTNLGKKRIQARYNQRISRQSATGTKTQYDITSNAFRCYWLSKPHPIHFWDDHDELLTKVLLSKVGMRGCRLERGLGCWNRVLKMQGCHDSGESTAQSSFPSSHACTFQYLKQRCPTQQCCCHPSTGWSRI